MSRHAISPEALSALRRQLEPLPPRSAERRQRIQEAAAFYGVSAPTLYRLLRQRRHPKNHRRRGWRVRRARRLDVDDCRRHILAAVARADDPHYQEADAGGGRNDERPPRRNDESPRRWGGA